MAAIAGSAPSAVRVGRGDGSVIWDGVALDVTDRREALEALERTLSQARQNEVSEGRFATIAATDFSDAAGRPAAGNHGITAGRCKKMPIQQRRLPRWPSVSMHSKGAVSATRDLVQAGERTKTQSGRASKPKSDRNLTRRQEEILQLVRQGASNRLIAETLGISEGTVKLHVSLDPQAAQRSKPDRGSTEVGLV